MNNDGMPPSLPPRIELWITEAQMKDISSLFDGLSNSSISFIMTGITFRDVIDYEAEYDTPDTSFVKGDKLVIRADSEPVYERVKFHLLCLIIRQREIDQRS